MSVNKVMLIGRLGKDPEYQSKNGNSVCKFSMATSESFKDKSSGQKRETTEWHNIVIFGKLAMIAGDYLKKGREVYIEGKLKTSSWETDSGEKKYKTDIIASQMQMLGGREVSGEAPKEKEKVVTAEDLDWGV